jgi:glycosyltransferase involved in cell wall biosynthesis
MFVSPGDDAALAEAILALYRSSELRQEMGANARLYVMSHFDRALQATQLRDLLQQHCVFRPTPVKRSNAHTMGA